MPAVNGRVAKGGYEDDGLVEVIDAASGKVPAVRGPRKKHTAEISN
jgi:hypothetical protein